MQGQDPSVRMHVLGEVAVLTAIHKFSYQPQCANLLRQTQVIWLTDTEKLK